MRRLGHILAASGLLWICAGVAFAEWRIVFEDRFERKAIGTIVVGPPCVFFPDRTDRYASAPLFFSPTPPSDPALLLPTVQLAIGDVQDDGEVVQFGFSAPAGSRVQMLTSSDLIPGTEHRLLPVIDGLVINPDGSFFGDGSVRTITIPKIPGRAREFYFLRDVVQDADAAPLPEPPPVLECRT